MATLASLIEATKNHVPDTLGEISYALRTEAVTEGLILFGHDIPRVVCDEATEQQVDASGTFPNWNPNYSHVVEVEWPQLDTEVVRLTTTLVDQFVGTSQEDVVRFINAFPTSGSPALVRFTALWTPETVPTAHESLVGLKASVCLCSMKEAIYTAGHDIEFGEQTVQSAKDQAEAFRALGATLEAKYQMLLGKLKA